jgi:hypothetical protein
MTSGVYLGLSVGFAVALVAVVIAAKRSTKVAPEPPGLFSRSDGN